MPLASLLWQPASLQRLLEQAFNITLAVIALFWLVWLALWLLGQNRRTRPDSGVIPLSASLVLIKTGLVVRLGAAECVSRMRRYTHVLGTVAP